jgi:hypothetical protein
MEIYYIILQYNICEIFRYISGFLCLKVVTFGIFGFKIVLYLISLEIGIILKSVKMEIYYIILQYNICEIISYIFQN